MTPEPYDVAIENAAAALREAKRRLLANIAAYPTPISGCDAQYVALMADRTRVIAALQALETEPFVATPRMLEPGATIEAR